MLCKATAFTTFVELFYFWGVIGMKKPDGDLKKLTLKHNILGGDRSYHMLSKIIQSL